MIAVAVAYVLAACSSSSDGGDSAPRVCGIFSRSLVDQLSGGVKTTSSRTITAPGRGPELQGCEIVSSGDQYLVATVKDLPTAARVRELKARVAGERATARSRCVTYRAIEDPGSGYVCRTSDGEVRVNLVTGRRLVRLILPSRSEEPTVARGLEVADVVAAQDAER